MQKKHVTISIPDTMLSYIDDVAECTGCSRSMAIVMSIASTADYQIFKEMEEQKENGGTRECN